MAIYAIGDIQGCYDELLNLLDLIGFNPANDQLWFVGDLVNRGPKSLETLRLIKSLGDSAITVLGNHDLHLLAASCAPLSTNRKTALNQVLIAPDRDELIDWLRYRPLFHYNDQFCMVHAGISPQWDFTQTQKMAHAVESVLQSKDYKKLLKAMYGETPDLWSPQLSGMARLRYAINCFTRMRYCTKAGRLDLNFSGSPGSQPATLMPWFNVPGRKNFDHKIVFGHWSSLGYYQGNGCYAIDTGCLWGGQLTALRLGDEVARFSVDSLGTKA
jgi:bis(5'-nucleosyl)-tetraphosphatase (symmetrical)